MTLGKKLVQLRKSQGMSQEALAAQIAVSRQAVSRWESGDTLPDVENILQLSRIFGITTDYLLWEEYGPEMEKAQERGYSCSADSPTASQREEPTLEKKGRSSCSRGLLVTGSILTGIGLAGQLVIWVLSTMIESFVPIATTDNQGTTWYTIGSGFSYSGFIEKYRLFAVVGIFWTLLIAGLLLLGWYYYRWKEGVTERRG